jgi:tape measure domain-containing protein
VNRLASLRSIFTLTDNYSSAINRITANSDKAYSSINKASSAVDNVDRSFLTNASSASALTSRITALASAYLGFETVKQAMDISDTYTNTNSKLSMITNSLAEQQALQQEIFSAADRARGSYSTMADTVAKLGITSGEQFGNTDNIVKFTETMQKMFKVGGTSTANQSGAMLQLQQAIGLGKLQGQDLRILAEDAPLVEKAIAQYMGKSTGEIKSLGTAGKITSQTLINSILAYSSTIDSQVGKMSYTWGDYWNKIKNGATKAFGSVFGDESKILGSQGFQTFINGIVGSFTVLASAANGALQVISSVSQFFSSNWSIIAPIILGIAAAFLALQIPVLLSAAAMVWNAICSAAETIALFLMTVATDGLNGAFLALNATLFACPLTWILLLIIAVIAIIYIVVAAINKVKGSTISATGIIAGSVLVMAAVIANTAIGVLNAIIQAVWAIFVSPFLGIIEWVLNATNGGFDSFGGAVANLIGQIIGWFLSLGKIVTTIIDAIFGSDWTSGLSSLQDSVTSWGKNNSAITIDKNAPEITNRFAYTNAWDTGYKWGSGVDSSVSSMFNGIGTSGTDALGTTSNPTTVTGTGSNGNVTVNIADQDLQYLRDLAEKDYVAKFSNSTLAPNITVHIDSSGNASTDKQLSSRISAILQEQISTSSEGSYA